MATDHGHDPHAHGPVNHETTDIHLDGVWKIVIGFALFMLVTVGAMYGTLRFLNSRDAAGQRTVGTMVEQSQFERPALMNGVNEIVGDRTPAGPKLLTHEAANLREFKTGQAQQLTTYGWVDRAGQVVHLPIARAMELTAERGLPVGAASAAMPADATADAAVQEAPAAADAGPVPHGEPD